MHHATGLLASLHAGCLCSQAVPSQPTALPLRCVSMLARLWHAPTMDGPNNSDAVGTACIGSSEAIMLGCEWPCVP